MKKILTYFALLIFIAACALSNAFAGSPTPNVQVFRLAPPLGFIENKGQFVDQNQKPRTDLLYLLKRPGMKVQLMKNHLSFEVYTMEAMNSFDEAKGRPDYSDLDPEDRPDPDFRYLSSRVDIEFIDANPNPEIVPEEMMPDYLNYYLAYTPVEGITRVKQFNKITYKNLYPNIDLVLIALPKQNPRGAMGYDFVVHPGGNLSDIKYRYHGNSGQVLHPNGTLETMTAQGNFNEMIPESYLQNEKGERIENTDVSFYFNKNVISFQTHNYDKELSLVVDPNLVWATYCGGDTFEEGRGLATDSAGNVAILGATSSTNNMATVGAYQTELVGPGDIFLDKYDSLGHRLWGTYYGGSSRDQARGIVADDLGNYYLGCHTDSPDGCATPDAWRPYFSGGVGDDALLAYFSKDGFRIWATYYGGAEEEIVRRLVIDKDKNVIMCGYTFSDTGIATPGVAQTVIGGNADLNVSKWTPDGQLIWGTYLGGDKQEHGRSVDVDKDGNIYVNGSVASEGLGTPGVSRPNYSNKQDFLLAKLTPDGQLGWFSYWGGKWEDRGRGVHVDSSSKYVYFIGYTASDTGIATPGAYQDHYNFAVGDSEFLHDAVVMKWTLTGQVVWATYLGGTHDDRGRAVTIIGDNEIYLSGSTESDDTMATPDAFDPVWGGYGDMYLELFDSTGYRKYGTYFGGHGDDDNLALAVDPTKQYIYLIGSSNSDSVATPGTAQTVPGGYDDALLGKIRVHPFITGIGHVSDPSSLNVYPNPVNDNFVLSFNNMKHERVTVDLNNLLGQHVQHIYNGTTPDQFSQQINVSTLPQGVYYVKVMIGNNSLVKKIIIQR